MALNQRRTEILNLIQEDGHAKVQKLSKIFKVSDVTIRQDLEELEKMGYVQSMAEPFLKMSARSPKPASFSTSPTWTRR